ncbi:MAG: class I SAM-dependent methyltransferase [Pseudomonadales bacterium]|nr:class I SAM-dependent methyltransferase [Pseudomonadales bacterium]
MKHAAHTWHHGLVARWWAEFNRDGDDIEFFRQAILRSGEPALDAGCGTGRLLLPFLRAGMDVEGADAAADMLHWCRVLAEREGLAVTLHEQPMHALELPRRYQTVIVCGAFGLGGTREDDLEGLRRIRGHLLPGGRLFLDHHLPNFDRRGWAAWAEQTEFPRPWSKRGDHRKTPEGFEMALRMRQLELDPLEQTTLLEIRAARLENGVEVEAETHTIRIVLYLKNEVELMLKMAGFASVKVTGGLEDRPAEPWRDERILFEAST